MRIESLPYNTQKWQTPRPIASVLTSGLDALANSTSESTGKAISAAIDNDSFLNTYMDLELLASYSVAPSAGSYVEIAIIPSLDGTNYTDGSTTVDPDGQLWVGRFYLRAVTGAQRLYLRGVLQPPFKYKVLLRNRAGQAMAASGNTLKARSYNLEVI